MHQFFSSAKAVIFDLDGTLYDQRKLRQRMLVEMLCRCMKHPSSISDMMILWNFRKAREENASCVDGGIERLQFKWGAERSRAPVEQVQNVVLEWMFKRPLQYMPACRYPGVQDLFSVLRGRGILIGVFSDYPARDKLDALGLEADVLVSATDCDVDRLKPDPMGLFATASKLNVSIQECIFIGDSNYKDGECARRAGMPYLIMNRRRNHNSNGFKSFFEITERVQMYIH